VQRSLQDPKGGNITALPEALKVREIPTLLQPLPVKELKCVPLPIKEVL
jgi:hypothetical protein